MGYRLNRLTEPVFIAVSKPLLTEFGIHYKLESCDSAFSVLFSGFSVIDPALGEALRAFVQRKMRESPHHQLL